MYDFELFLSEFAEAIGLQVLWNLVWMVVFARLERRRVSSEVRAEVMTLNVVYSGLAVVLQTVAMYVMALTSFLIVPIATVGLLVILKRKLFSLHRLELPNPWRFAVAHTMVLVAPATILIFYAAALGHAYSH